MRFPIITSFFVSVLVFIPSVYVGGVVAEKAYVRYKRSVEFSSLGPEEEKLFDRAAESLSGYELSCMMAGFDQKYLAAQVPYLQSLRAKAPQEIWPIFDLRIAADHSMLAQLAEKQGKPSEAAAHREAARSLLRGLGWKDVSDTVLNDLADRHLHSLPRVEL